ncbi:MAG: ferredoxin--NADP(+) reductase [Bacteroidia bacterium]|nr:MAG: ferredoxin--NADP(+) reductase [Bacteroidia bacterium]
MENQLNAVVTQIIQVSPIMKIFRISPDGWELPEFVPGQFATLSLPGTTGRVPEATPDPEGFKPEKMIKRAYSIASSSKKKEFIEFYISLVTSGALTPRLFNLKIGDRIELGKRMVGMFTLSQVPEGNNIVLVATGTGVAPYVSMLRSNVLNINSTNKIAIIHGASNSWDLGYRSELMLLENMSDRFFYLPTVIHADKEHIKWTGDTRYVQDMWAAGVIEEAFGEKPRPENTHIFLCGNPKMVEGMFEVLGKDGFKEHKRKEPGQIHVESW